MASIRSVVVLTSVLFFSLPVGAQICVDARNQAGVPDGTALKPFRTVQAGVDAASPGQAVLVATGTYTEDVRVSNRTVLLLGGYAGGSAVQYGGGTAGNFTTRDISGTPTRLVGTGNDSVVTVLDGGATLVEGFVITGGGGSTEDLPYASSGGGIFVRGGAPIIRNNVIEGNDPTRPGDVTTFGGGIYSESADATIEGNAIAENTAQRGAGIAAVGGMIIIRNNTIRGNVGTGDHGGGMYIGCPNATITGNEVYENEIGRDLGYGWGGGIIVFNPGNYASLSFNRFYRNYAPGLGAGIFIDEAATAELRHELVYQNEVNDDQAGGGAVYVDGGVVKGVVTGSIVSIVNCTIADNPVQGSYLGGNGLFVEGASTVTVRNTILWGNGLEIWADPTSSIGMTYCNVGENVPGAGNFSQDPLFADMAGGDFHLRSTAGRWDPAANGGLGGFLTDGLSSPSIDAGHPFDAFAAETAPNGGRINQGAYGNTAEASRSDGGAIDPDLNNDSVVNAVDVQLVINAALGVGGSADVNSDGATNAVDVQLVINAALGV